MAGRTATASWPEQTPMTPPSRFPRSLIQSPLGLRLSPSQREIQELCRECGGQVGHERLRQWNIRCAPLLPEEMRHVKPSQVISAAR